MLQDQVLFITLTPNESMSLTKIKDIRFVPNSVGGSIVIEANGPMTFTENLNPQTQKLLVEIPNARFESSINPFQQVSDATESVESIETSQNGNTAQVIVQVGKSGARPTLQQEGNSLLIIAKGQPPPSSPSGEGGGLSDFFGSNHKYYGKKISMEVSDMDLKDVLAFVAAESGINLVMSDAISGKISLKLRQVPWDQALVMIMGTKDLGYVRQGNVIRIVPIKNLQEEEKTKQEVLRIREDSSPLVVRTFPLNYAKPEDIGKVAKPFLTQRGKDNVEPRSNSLVITDIQEVVDRIARMIPALDVSPPQVLIEGKLVEAQEKFTRELGLRWGLNAQPMSVGSAGAQLNSNLSVSPQGTAGSGVFNYNLNVGTLDVLGDLNAFLSLSESEENVKVISSPRVLTLHNEQAIISQSTEIPLIGSTVQTTGAISKSVTFKEIALQLKVTPTVATDGTIIMLVEVSRSFVAGKADPETNASPINNRTAKTKVIVRNGQTAVIGGIYQSDATEIERGVTGLSSIPVLGSLFKYKYKSKDKNELLVFLTPRIMGKEEFMAGGGDGTEF